MKLQSVELRVPDVDAAARFFRETWGLSVAGNGAGAVRLRGTAALPYLLSLEQGEPAILSITFCGSEKEREVRGPEGELYRFVVERAEKELPPHADRPIALSHDDASQYPKE